MVGRDIPREAFDYGVAVLNQKPGLDVLIEGDVLQHYKCQDSDVAALLRWQH